MHQTTRETGAGSESAAAEFLRRKGYDIIQTNYYCRYGELDIIAVQGDELVFVEVKSSHVPEIDPLEMLQPHKLRRIQRSIDHWLLANRRQNSAWRFDFIGIKLGNDMQVQTITHIESPEL